MYLNFDAFVSEQFEEGGKKWGKFFTVDCFIAINVKKIEKILYIVAGRLLPSD